MALVSSKNRVVAVAGGDVAEREDTGGRDRGFHCLQFLAVDGRGNLPKLDMKRTLVISNKFPGNW